MKNLFNIVQNLISFDIELPFLRYFQISVESMKNLVNFTLEGFSIISNQILNLTSSPAIAIHDRAYFGTGIIQAIIPSTVQTIGNYVFGSCSNLNKVVIENSLTNLGAYLFYSCISIESLSIGGKIVLDKGVLDLSITEIEQIQSNCFHLCPIRKIIFSNRNIQIGLYSFSDNALLEQIEFKGVPQNFSATSAFHGCSHLSCIIIPQELNCSNFEKFDFLTTFSSSNLVGFNSWCGAICEFPFQSETSSAIIVETSSVFNSNANNETEIGNNSDLSNELEEESFLTSGIIALIVIAVLVLIVSIIIIVYFLVKKSKQPEYGQLINEPLK